MNLRKSNKRLPVHHGSQESLLDPSFQAFTDPSDFLLLQDRNIVMAEVLSISPLHSPHPRHTRHQPPQSASLTDSEADSAPSHGAAPANMVTASASFPSHSIISPGCRGEDDVELSLLTFVFEALRRSGLSCQGSEDQIQMDIGCPTDVRHVAHVTFDRFNGFLGLPAEFQMEIPRRVPSASVSAFGVSAESMQCAYDRNGNSVPVILLLLQERLYDQGGLKAEGIFRINAENSQEERVRSELNHGTVPYDIDVHCLAGLIKAWFRELPRGVLDSLSPEQVLQCNTEEQAVQLVKRLPPMQAALLDWGINLMADVVQEEPFNKMNAHNIAMVFAPNMTQMSDPLTALMHAVQVMNLLKMLIVRVLKDREEALLDLIPSSTCSEPPSGSGRDNATKGASVSSRGAGDSQMMEETEAFLRSFRARESSISDYESAHYPEELFATKVPSKYEHEFSSERQGSTSNMSSSLDGHSNDSSPQKLILPEESQGIVGYGSAHDTEQLFTMKYEHELSSEMQGSSTNASSSLDGNSDGSSPQQLILPRSPIPGCWNSVPNKSELSNLVKDLSIKSEGIEQLIGRVGAW